MPWYGSTYLGELSWTILRRPDFDNFERIYSSVVPWACVTLGYNRKLLCKFPKKFSPFKSPFFTSNKIFSASKTLSSSQKEILVDIDCSSLITPKLVPNGLYPRLNSLNKNLSNGIIGNNSSQNGGKQQKQLRKETPIIKKQKLKNKIFGKTESNLKNCFKLMSEEDDDFDEEEEDKKEIVGEEEEEELMEKSMRGVNGNNGTNDRKQWTKSSMATTSNDKDVWIL